MLRRTLRFFTFTFVLVVVLAAVGSASAAEKPRPFGEFFIPISLLYNHQLGGATGVGYQFRSNGVLLMAQATYTYDDDVSGSTPFRVGWRTYDVPYAVNGKGSAGFALTVAIPVRKSGR